MEDASQPNASMANKVKAAENPPVRMVKPKKTFNPSAYKFHKKDYNFRQEAFIEQFYENKKANKLKINQQLVEQTYLQVINRFKIEKKDGNFPKEFRENEMLWAGQMMRSKCLQKLMAEMTHKVAQALEQEIKGNKELISDWLGYPHSYSQSPKRNTVQLEQMQSRVWYPQVLPQAVKVTPGVSTARQRHRAMLDDMARQKKEQMQEIEEEAAAMPTLDANDSMRMSQDSVKSKNQPRKSLKLQAKIMKKPIKAKAKLKKVEKPSMTPYEEALHERLIQAKSYIDDVEVLNESFEGNLDEIRSELKDMDRERSGKNPGYELKKMMKKWSEVPYDTPDQLNHYMMEPVMALQEIEDFLKDKQTGLQLELKQVQKQSRCRIDGLRNQAGMQIEALESALIETKIKYSREQERSDMRLAEMESQVFNMQQQKQELTERVYYQIEANKNAVFQELEDKDKIFVQNRMIIQLLAAYHDNNHEKSCLRNEKNDLIRERDRNKAMNDKSQGVVMAWLGKILYYQDALFEVLSRTGLLSNLNDNNKKSPISKDKQTLIRELYFLNVERNRKIEEMKRTYRLEDDRKKKEVELLEEFIQQFHETFLEVDFINVFGSYQDTVQAKQDSIEKLTKELEEMGVLDGEKLEYRNQQLKAEMEEKALEMKRIQARMPQQKQKRDEKSKRSSTRTMEGLSVQINEQRLVMIHDSFNELTKPISVGMGDLIRSVEDSFDNKYLDSEKKYDHKLGAYVGLYVNANKKIEAEKREFMAAMEKKQVKLEQELAKNERRMSKNTKKGKDSGPQSRSSQPKMPKAGKNAQPAENLTSIELAQQKQPSSKAKMQEKSEQPEGGPLIAVESDKQNMTIKGDEIGPPTPIRHSSGVSNGLKSKLQSMPVESQNVVKREASEDSDGEVELDLDDSDDGIKVKDIDESDDEDNQSKKSKKGKTKDTMDNFDLLNKPGEKKNLDKKKRTNMSVAREKAGTSQKSGIHSKQRQGASSPPAKRPGSINKSNRNASPMPLSRRKVSTMQDADDNASRAGNKKDRKVSVLIKKNQEDQQMMTSQMASQIVSGSDGDIADTEPIYCLKDVIDELEKKVLLKYKDELEEIEGPIKLKAGDQKQLIVSFMSTLGEKITAGEETTMITEGKLEEMIGHINKTREKYLKPARGGFKGISVERLDSTKQQETDAWFKIPMNDCILTQINEDGNVTGFNVRPEIMTLVVSKEDGDLSFVNRVIRTANYLNRMFFSDNDYNLTVRGKQDDSALSRQALLRRIPTGVEMELEDVAPTPIIETLPEERTDTESSKSSEKGASEVNAIVLRLLMQHMCAISAKGVSKYKSYELMQAKGQNMGLQEVINKRLIDVFETLDSVDREEMGTQSSGASMNFHEYLEAMFTEIEEKLEKLPQENRLHLSIQDLVHLDVNKEANVKDVDKSNSDSSSDYDDVKVREVEKRVRKECEEEYNARLESELQAQVQIQIKKLKASSKQPMVPRYTQQQHNSPSSSAKKQFNPIQTQPQPPVIKSVVIHKEVQTTDDLLEAVLAEKTNVGEQMAKEYINEHLQKEMGATIQNLYEYLDRLQANKELSDKEKQKRNMRSQGPLNNRLKDPRHSIVSQGSTATHLPSNASEYQQRAVLPCTPNAQRMAINTMIAQEITSLNQERKQTMLKTAEQNISRRRVFPEKGNKSHRANNPPINFTLVQPKLPSLQKINDNQSLQSERNYAHSVTCEVGLMPQLHNSMTKTSALVQKPFKQGTHINAVTVDRRILNVDSTHRGFSSQMKPEATTRRSSNVPGLIATGVPKKFDFSSTQKIKEAEVVPLHDSSFESKDFEYVTSGSVKVDELNASKHNRSFHHGGINISSLNNVQGHNNGSMMQAKVSHIKVGAMTQIPPFPKPYEMLNNPPRTHRGSVFASEEGQGILRDTLRPVEKSMRSDHKGSEIDTASLMQNNCFNSRAQFLHSQ